MDQLTNKLATIEARARDMFAEIKSSEDLKLCRARLLGRSGAITDLLKMLSSLSPEERPVAGRQINTLKEQLQNKLAEAETMLESRHIDKALSQADDVTLPGRLLNPAGLIHPVTQILNKIEEIFTSLGFSIFEGSEVETDYYNFEALNVPKDHPARDMQDTFYINPPSPPS